MSRSKTIDSNIGLIGVGTFEQYAPWGTQLGGVLNEDSINVTVFNAQDAYAEAIRKASASQYTVSQFGNAVAFLNNPTDDETNFYDSIQIVEDYAYWLWGNVASGGVFFYDPQDPNWHPYEISIMACNGCYAKDINGVTHYKYNISGGVSPFRRYEDLASCFIGYRWDSDSIGFVTLHYDNEERTVKNIPLLAYNPTTNNYVETGSEPTLAPINATKKKMVNLSPPPLMLRALVLAMDGANTKGGLNDVGTIFDDENYSLGDGWQKLHGAWYGDSAVPPQPPYDPSDDGGGVDDYTEREDDTSKTDVTQFDIDAVNSGLVTIFNPSQNEIREFSNFLFSGITEDIAQFFKRLISSPLDYIISLNMVHYRPATHNSAEIKFGGIGSGVASMVVTDQYEIIDCGSQAIQRQWGSFLDYGGYTKARIYLPYCGIHDIDIDLSIDATIQIQYIIDNLSGACVAQVVVNHERRYSGDRRIKGTRYEFTGNVFEQVPLSAADYRSAINGVLTAMGGVGAVAAGNPVSGISAIASGVMSMKPTIQTASKVGSSFGYMGLQKPFIEVTRPNPSVPLNYPYREGYPANIYAKLNDRRVSGYIKIEKGTFKYDNIDYITEEEGRELVDLLESGVFLTNV